MDMETTYQDQDLKETYLEAGPFPHAVLDEFLDETSANQLLNALQEQEFSEKYADLFSFWQTADLNGSEDPVIRQFISLIKEMKAWFEMTTKQTLTGELDIQGTNYTDTDFLLCHDDQLETRKIAFIYYLTDLDESEGGGLTLYYSAQGKPLANKSITIQPKKNRFVFFTVSPRSFHEVQEVLVKKDRLTINGWLH